MRAIMNQHTQMYTLYSLGVASEDTWQYAAQQAAQIWSTPGGTSFRETNAYETSALMQAIAPYMGQKLQSSFSLGRPAEDF